MRTVEFRLPSWFPPLTALILLPCAVELGRFYGWTPGAASLVLSLIPIMIASVGESSWGLLLTTLIAAASSLREGWMVSQATNGFVEVHSFSLFSTVVLLFLGPLLRQLIGRNPGVAESPEEPVLPGESVEPTNADTTTEESGPLAGPALPSETLIPAASVADLLVQTELPIPTMVVGSKSEHHEPDDPQLLLTLQEVGWRVATDYDLATLYQTVRHTTQRILRCERCSVLLWNAPDCTLSDALQCTEPGQTPVTYVNRGMLGWVAKNRQLLIRSDVENDPALTYLQRRDESHIEAVAPLTAGGELLGLLALEGVNASTPQFRRMLQLLANVSALAIKNARLFQRIAEMARRDGLTGLLNHASFQEKLRELVDTAQCQQQPLTIIMADVDRFKSINDAHGHPVGDQVLREVGRIWRTVVPEQALSARYGGEEFICAIPGMELNRGADLAEALRHTIETLPLSLERGILNVTASFGVAQLGFPARNATELVQLADEALYQSKRTGRNRVTLIPVAHRPVTREHAAS